jgi:steroid 5-alpha reductase family enzyme
MTTGFRDARWGPLVACSIAYVTAFVAAIWSLSLVPDWDPIWATFLADIVGTIVIFLFGMIFRNSSLYDPYWSVVPIVIALFWLATPVMTDVNITRGVLATLLVALWGLRLTFNCFRRWTNMAHEDFRYQDFRKSWGKFYFVVDLFGIQLMPTLMVFAACLPLYPITAVSNTPLNILDLVALIVTLGAIVIETVSDQNLQKYLTSNPPAGSVCKVGLWQYSRHPNYFGEVGFWWGLYLFALAAGPEWWWTGIGALAVNLLFVFISIPMMEKRKRIKRPDYDEQVAGISILIPMPKKKI